MGFYGSVREASREDDWGQSMVKLGGDDEQAEGLPPENGPFSRFSLSGQRGGHRGFQQSTATPLYCSQLSESL